MSTILSKTSQISNLYNKNECFLISTFVVSETNPAKKGTSRQIPRSKQGILYMSYENNNNLADLRFIVAIFPYYLTGCENIQPDWWCRNNYGRCWGQHWDREVGRLCRRTCDDSYYCGNSLLCI